MDINWNDLPAWFVFGSMGLLIAVAFLFEMVKEARRGRLPQVREMVCFPFGGGPNHDYCSAIVGLCIFISVFGYLDHDISIWRALLKGIPIGVAIYLAVALISVLYARGVILLVRKCTKR